MRRSPPPVDETALLERAEGLAGRTLAELADVVGAPVPPDLLRTYQEASVNCPGLPWPVVAAWFVGGIFLLWWVPNDGTIELTGFTMRHAAIIGFAQILALWPGVSRSLITIVAALAIGATMSAAVEFAFLLGLATLSAATFFDLSQTGSVLVDDYGIATPVFGAVVAFITAVVAVRWLVSTLRTRPLSIFGWYRIFAAVATAALLGANVI